MRQAAPHKVGIYMFEIVSGNPERIGQKYIGQAKRNARERENYHWSFLKRGKHTNHLLQSYYNKYGKDSLRYTFLFECPVNELNFWEKWWIKSFDSYGENGLNLTAGGIEAVQQYKPCSFKNIKTGEIVYCESRKHFAQKYGFAHGSVNELVNGEIFYLRDWIYPPNEHKIKKHKIISPDGVEYEIYDGKIKEFCKEHGLGYYSISQLLGYSTQFTKDGWYRPDSKIDKSNWKNCTEFKFLSPDGKIFIGNVLNKFCKENNLNYSCMIRLKNGNLNKHKGWTKYKE